MQMQIKPAVLNIPLDTVKVQWWFSSFTGKEKPQVI
jgi:hypothetical protein